MFRLLILLSSLFVLTTCSNYSRRFPDGFLLGVATSAAQIEGAWNISKGLSIWDVYATRADYKAATKHGHTPEIACDSYHKYKRDIEMLKELNVKSYRFSIAMPRILPNGQPNAVNKEGVEYYNKIIDLLIENNITPIVTIYHYELPQALQDLGGFTNPLIELWLTSYARILYQNFGDRVKYWLTINEPLIICSLAYNALGTLFPPGINATGIAEYICVKNVLMAHAGMYRLYEREFKATQKGKVSFAAAVFSSEPESNSLDDIEATKHFKELSIHLLNDPIFSKQGDWPQYMKDYISKKSKEQGFPYSRLPELTSEEVKFIRGTYDFFGLNYYDSFTIYRNATSKLSIRTVPSLFDDLNAGMIDAKTTIAPAIGNPEGVRKVLNYFKNRYGVTDALITENGYSSNSDATLDDDLRIISIRATLEEILKAIYEDHINVFGYEYWSLMDHFDFADGYNVVYSLYYTDFKSDEKRTTPRKSAKVFQQIVTDGAINWDYNPRPPYIMKPLNSYTKIIDKPLFNNKIIDKPRIIDKPLFNNKIIDKPRIIDKPLFNNKSH